MKKLFKKKVSFLGKDVSVFAIVLVAMATLATAALVPYISNTLTGNFVTESPIELLDIDFNFDINYDSKLSSPKVSIGSAASGANKTLISKDKNESIRVIVYGINDNIIKDGPVVEVTFTAVGAGISAIKLSNIKAVNAQSRRVDVIATNGKVIIAEVNSPPVLSPIGDKTAQ